MNRKKYIQIVYRSRKTCLRHNEKWLLIKIIFYTIFLTDLSRLGGSPENQHGSDHMYHAM
jgi:hypothetical protein